MMLIKGKDYFRSRASWAELVIFHQQSLVLLFAQKLVLLSPHFEQQSQLQLITTLVVTMQLQQKSCCGQLRVFLASLSAGIHRSQAAVSRCICVPGKYPSAMDLRSWGYFISQEYVFSDKDKKRWAFDNNIWIRAFAYLVELGIICSEHNFLVSNTRFINHPEGFHCLGCLLCADFQNLDPVSIRTEKQNWSSLHLFPQSSAGSKEGNCPPIPPMAMLWKRENSVKPKFRWSGLHVESWVESVAKIIWKLASRKSNFKTSINSGGGGWSVWAVRRFVDTLPKWRVLACGSSDQISDAECLNVGEVSLPDHNSGFTGSWRVSPQEYSRLSPSGYCQSGHRISFKHSLFRDNVPHGESLASFSCCPAPTRPFFILDFLDLRSFPRAVNTLSWVVPGWSISDTACTIKPSRRLQLLVQTLQFDFSALITRASPEERFRVSWYQDIKIRRDKKAKFMLQYVRRKRESICGLWIGKESGVACDGK